MQQSAARPRAKNSYLPRGRVVDQVCGVCHAAQVVLVVALVAVPATCAVLGTRRGDSGREVGPSSSLMMTRLGDSARLLTGPVAFQGGQKKWNTISI